MANLQTKLIRRRAETLRLHRTEAALDSATEASCVIRIVQDHDPSICVACGHKHNNMTRHHRIPRRVAHSIPEDVGMLCLKGGSRIVPLCVPCHRHIETKKGSPCTLSRNEQNAVFTYEYLIAEIELFDLVAAQELKYAEVSHAVSLSGARETV